MFMIRCGTSAREPGELLDHDHDEAGAAINEAEVGRGGAAILALGQSGNERRRFVRKEDPKQERERRDDRRTTDDSNASVFSPSVIY